MDRLRTDWRARAEEHGFGPERIDELVDRAERSPDAHLDLARVATDLAGENGVTRENSTFDRRAVIQAWAQAYRRGAKAADLEGRQQRLASKRRTQS